jgi:hypothetical protein
MATGDRMHGTVHPLPDASGHRCDPMVAATVRRPTGTPQRCRSNLCRRILPICWENTVTPRRKKLSERFRRVVCGSPQRVFEVTNRDEGMRR